MSCKSGVLFLRDGTQIKIPCESKHIGDGAHTFKDLYQHRDLLFVALMKIYPERSWRSKHHDDGSSRDGWFICGMRAPYGDLTYHMPDSMWDLLNGIEEKKAAPPWDGHTPGEVLRRLKNWIVSDIWGR